MPLSHVVVLMVFRLPVSQLLSLQAPAHLCRSCVRSQARVPPPLGLLVARELLFMLLGALLGEHAHVDGVLIHSGSIALARTGLARCHSINDGC